MDTKHEALETADRCDSLASIFDAWSPDTYERAAALLRRQHARIEELEEACKDAEAALEADVDPVKQWPFNIRALKKKALASVKSALLTKKD
jgi:hypothetical protein